MSQRRWHLAQLNVGRMVAPTSAPEIAEFMAALEPINALADAAPGFVWRLQTDAGNATDIHAFDDPLLLLNMSVWQSIEALRAFTYSSAHTEVLRRRREWFDRLDVAHLVLWWVPVGHIPSVGEAIDRLERLRRGRAHGRGVHLPRAIPAGRSRPRRSACRCGVLLARRGGGLSVGGVGPAVPHLPLRNRAATLRRS